MNLGSPIVLAEGQIYLVAGSTGGVDPSVMARFVRCQGGKLENMGGRCLNKDGINNQFDLNGCTSTSWSSNMNCLRSAEGASGMIDITTSADHTYYAP